MSPHSAPQLGMATGEVKCGELDCAYPKQLGAGLQGSTEIPTGGGKTQSEIRESKVGVY